MTFIKLGEAIEITGIEESSSVLPVLEDKAIEEHFRRYAAEIKRVAPRAEDFLYFSAVMMHAAEASALNDDGTPKLTARGEPVKVGWDTSNGTWKWTTNDPSIKPVKNANGDIFPEAELIKAYKKWKDKPLCIDHRSDSVDYVRGFIVDTYYDRALKRVVALCALDKLNYPDLARKVASGYSNSVSMGTAVGRAICSDCGQVARTERDFCNHMKTKSAYGEINVDLSPIELSIVVNGADHKAKIKHIIASVNTLNSYVETKKARLEELKKKAFENQDLQGLVERIEKQSQELEDLKSNLESLLKNSEDASAELSTDASELEDVVSTNDSALHQTESTNTVEETALPTTDFNIAPPAQRFASLDDAESFVSNLRDVISSIDTKLDSIKQGFDKLSNLKEENMADKKDLNKLGYYQGTEEPSPGETKYEKEPLNENLRTDGDKHMMVQDTGPVDGMFPGDLEKKKMLARAQAEERALRRESAVAKAKEALGYFQGTEEPTPGKPQYAKDPMNDKLREGGDKHMDGEKPFPGVGSVNEMYPGDKQLKERIQRASYKARFVKAANQDGSQNIGQSTWEVSVGDNVVLTTTVEEIAGGQSEKLYDVIATKEFGSKLIENVKKLGAAKVKSLYKSAQEAPAPAAAPAAEPAPEAPATAPAADADGGDPKAPVKELLGKLKEVVSDLEDACAKLVGEEAEMGNLSEMGAQASETNKLQVMRKELNGALTQSLKQSIAGLNDQKEELSQIVEMYSTNGKLASDEVFSSLVADSVESTKAALADSFKLMGAFVKYARGTEAIVKSAEVESELNKLAEENGDVDMASDKTSSDMSDADDLDLMSMLADDDLQSLDSMDCDCGFDHASDPASALSWHDAHGHGHDMGDTNDAAMVDVETPAGKKVTVPEGSKVSEASFDLTTKAGRTAYRAKLAAEALKVSPSLHDAHPKGGETTKLDVKPSGNLAEVEDLEGVHDAMMDLATAPPKVRKEAEEIQKLVAKGELDPNDLDALVAEGLDKDAVAYWKKLWGQAGPAGSQFASELVKEHVKAKMDAEISAFKVKIARAYELAYDMVDRGLCQSDRSSISDQVEEIMQFNDASFESLKKVVASNKLVTASRMPQVGVYSREEVVTREADDASLLAQAFSGNNKRLF